MAVEEDDRRTVVVDPALDVEALAGLGMNQHGRLGVVLRLPPSGVTRRRQQPAVVTTLADHHPDVPGAVDPRDQALPVETPDRLVQGAQLQLPALVVAAVAAVEVDRRAVCHSCHLRAAGATAALDVEALAAEAAEREARGGEAPALDAVVGRVRAGGAPALPGNHDVAVRAGRHRGAQLPLGGMGVDPELSELRAAAGEKLRLNAAAVVLLIGPAATSSEVSETPNTA